jgi:hypothetical protein
LISVSELFGQNQWYFLQNKICPIKMRYLYLRLFYATQLDRSKEYYLTQGKGPFHTHFRVRVMVIIENPTVTEMQNSNSQSVLKDG